MRWFGGTESLSAHRPFGVMSEAHHTRDVRERLRKLSKRLGLDGYPLASAYPCKARCMSHLLARSTLSVGTPGR